MGILGVVGMLRSLWDLAAELTSYTVYSMYGGSHTVALRYIKGEKVCDYYGCPYLQRCLP